MHPPFQPPVSSELRSASKHPWLWGLALLAALAALGRTHGIGLMGFDSYPLILTARIENWTDFLGSFREELMDGRYSGHYFRPLLNLSFALDRALWGLGAFGYQLTGAVCFGACGWALGRLLERLLGERALFGTVAGLLFFLLHDSHFEVIPVPARRPELLCGLFACQALASQLSPRALARRWSWAPTFWMLLAAASKETGYALPAVAVVAVWLYSPLPNSKLRAGHALRVGLAHALVIGALLGLRLWALGGLGGPAPLPSGLDLPGPLELSFSLLQRLALPQNTRAWGLVVPIIAALAALALIGGWFSGCSREPQARPRALLCAPIVALAWIVLVVLLYGKSRSIEQWYLFLPVMGLSLLVGATVELLWRGLRASVGWRGKLAGLGLVCVTAFAFCQTRYTPLLMSYPQWRIASAASDQFFRVLEERIEQAPAGATIKAPALPERYPPAARGPSIRGVAILKDYSVQAWLELQHPERRFRVLKGPRATSTEPGVSVVQLIKRVQF